MYLAVVQLCHEDCSSDYLSDSMTDS